MKWKEIQFYQDKQIIHDICFNCNSKTMKDSFSYIGLMYYRFPKNIVAEIFGNKAFYVVSKAKNHWRLIGIAINKDFQNQGLGKMTLKRLLERMKKDGVNTLTFRTNQYENAANFWLSQGSEIVGVKGNDFEMKLEI